MGALSLFAPGLAADPYSRVWIGCRHNTAGTAVCEGKSSKDRHVKQMPMA